VDSIEDGTIAGAFRQFFALDAFPAGTSHQKADVVVESVIEQASLNGIFQNDSLLSDRLTCGGGIPRWALITLEPLEIFKLTQEPFPNKPNR
jgi:hypothetical protein